MADAEPTSETDQPANPFLVEENCNQSGYNIVGYDNRFFAIHQNDGAFDRGRVIRNEYSAPVFEARTLGEIRSILAETSRKQELRVSPAAEVDLSAIQKARESLPPDHYYSPYPSLEDIRAFARFDRKLVTTMPGIDFDIERHTAHLQEMTKEYASLPPFPKSKVADSRYYYDNEQQWYFDALAIQHFVLACRPRRIIEIGGGYSTAAMMDAVDRCGARTQFTMIEPDPVRLRTLLRPQDLASHKLIEDKTQNVPLETFDQLQADDILFIDSSHVSKFRSDVNWYFFEILPRLKPGVFIHIHDIGYPFEYSPDFLEGGLSWTEAYMLRAFLMYNTAFRIEFWSAYASHFQGGLIAEKMPLCRQWPGGAFWMRRL
jgi:hypothetical protein